MSDDKERCRSFVPGVPRESKHGRPSATSSAALPTGRESAIRVSVDDEMNVSKQQPRRGYEFCGSFRAGAGKAGLAAPGKRVWQTLAETLVNTDPPHRFAGSLDPEVGDQLDA